jgi:hypothetical protein
MILQVHADGSVHVTVCTQHVAIVTGAGCFADKCALANSGCNKRVTAVFCLQHLHKKQQLQQAMTPTMIMMMMCTVTRAVYCATRDQLL